MSSAFSRSHSVTVSCIAAIGHVTTAGVTTVISVRATPCLRASSAAQHTAVPDS